MTVTIRIVVRDPVPGVWAAVQTGHGSAGQPHLLQKHLSDPAEWTLELGLKGAKPSGPFVQKDSKGAFVYLLWGSSAGQLGSGIAGRTKVYLPTEPEFAEFGSSWRVEIPGRGRNGQPAFATVTPLVPWTREA